MFYTKDQIIEEAKRLNLDEEVISFIEKASNAEEALRTMLLFIA